MLLATPLVILYVGALLAELPFGEYTREFLGSLVGAVAFSLLLAGLSLVIAAITPRRGHRRGRNHHRADGELRLCQHPAGHGRGRE